MCICVRLVLSPLHFGIVHKACVQTTCRGCSLLHVVDYQIVYTSYFLPTLPFAHLLYFWCMERIRKIVIQGKEILAIDYSGLKEPGMIALATEVKQLLLRDADEKLLINSFHHVFATPGYMRHLERESVEIKPFIKRNALVGLNLPKMMILKGLNLLMNTDFRAFATEQEALEYLIGEPLIDHPAPIFAL